jgi:hypothetical protein
MDRRFEGWSGRRGAGSCALLLATIAALSACGGQTGQDSSSAPSFGSPRDYAPGTGSVAIGDLNGDGKPYLVTGKAGGDGVSVLRNRGDGSFEAKRDYAAGGTWSIAIGDLNGDGKPELVTANNDANSSPCSSTQPASAGGGTRTRTPPGGTPDFKSGAYNQFRHPGA